MSYKDLEFQWYKNGIKSIKPGGNISLEQFVNSVISPTPKMITAFKEIEEASKAGNKKRKDELKQQNLFFVTPSVYIKGIRNYECIERFLPFAVLEYDGIPHAGIMRDYIFEKMPSCIFATLSPSKSGAKFLFHISTPKTILEYKELYFGIAHHLNKFKNLDLANANAVLPFFNSYDPDAKFRGDAVMWTQRGYKEGSFIPFEGEFDPPEDINEKDKQEVIDLITHLFNRIESEGHPQVVRASSLCGGFVGSQYIGSEEALELVYELIENNSYLSKGTQGYKLTAKTMLLKSINSPVLLKRHQNNE